MREARVETTGWKPALKTRGMVDGELSDQFLSAIRERDFWEAFSLVGNEDRHRLLLALWTAMTGEELRSVIPFAWDSGPRVHRRDIKSRKWLAIFQKAGFVAPPGVKKPEGIITIFRGAPTATKGWGMSWSKSLRTANWFRDRWRSRGIPAETFVTTLPPAALLAFVNDRHEEEFIINPFCLRGKQAPTVYEEVSP